MHIPMVSSEQWLRRPEARSRGAQVPTSLVSRIVQCVPLWPSPYPLFTYHGNFIGCKDFWRLLASLPVSQAAQRPTAAHGMACSRQSCGNSRSHSCTLATVAREVLRLLALPDLVHRAQLVSRTKIESRTLGAKCSATSFWGVCPCCAGTSGGWQEWRIPQLMHGLRESRLKSLAWMSCFAVFFDIISCDCILFIKGINRIYCVKSGWCSIIWKEF